MKKLLAGLRRQFHHEWAFRLFCVLTVAGLLSAVALDWSKGSWRAYPYFTVYQETPLKYRIAQALIFRKCTVPINLYGKTKPMSAEQKQACQEAKARLTSAGPSSKTRYSVRWDLLERRHWRLSSRLNWSINWVLVLLLFGPFVVVRALDWIFAGKRDS